MQDKMYDFITVIMKPSHRCNFNCSYCYDRFERSKDSSILPKEDLIMAIEKFAKQAEHMQLIWHGGEPTVLGIDYFKTVMEHFKDNENIQWSMQSNGSLLNDDWIDLCKEYNIHVGLSWDGITQNTTRSPIDIVKIKNLMDKQSVPWGLLMTVTKENSNTLIPVLQYALQLKINVGLNHIFGKDVTKEDYRITAHNLIDAFDFLCKVPNMPLTRPFTDIINLYVGLPKEMCETRWCATRWFAIEPNGDIYPCGKPWKSKCKYGSIYDDFDITKLINSDGCSYVLSLKQRNIEHCKNCENFTLCQGGCLYYTQYGEGEEEDYKFDSDYCFYQRTLTRGVIEVLEHNLETGELRNGPIIAKMNAGSAPRSKKWKNYKYPSI